ncbi:peroxisomal acyl-coenzyme A oxidase 1-like [Mizuhopecten yessoensis]|uniref:Acyl-coenzyme A oxidase n=1 Tax=Mizuhopecten yessoensis TaxID=6573 RepID=A0A210QMW6_MIZYE|nr:peroxisomal acyl-coenzyme A oxidase 1-like [Mizuhopecten yessoensis]XP_021354422.1 peroxisomal acyl-coenzyme A oxidase 1-like [Mizuhopecten yessoensis]OWF50076.1 Peroxisomal acyl-coenzyme A oxidase 1 [Mizuhopecten yessoensis]
MASAVNPDLERERKRATFDRETLTNFLYGGAQKKQRRRYLKNAVFSDPEYQAMKSRVFCSREELYALHLQKYSIFRRIQENLNITDQEECFIIRQAIGPNEYYAIGVHGFMFIPTIQKLGTEEQKRKWLPLAENLTIIGTYAQTELGHGTFIRGLETTATYDPKTQEFVLNSPTITSMKYWPANLGKTSNYCVIMAVLNTQGKNHGLHSFMVPLRDLKTHKSLPGVEVGDLGPKFGFNENDNGFLRLHHVRIPRDHMLMRYAKVAEDGAFTVSTNEGSRLTYGTMLFVRAMIVSGTSTVLGMACTVATRYSAVRRQTEVSPGGPEAQIMDYQTQQYKLFPLIATAYAFRFTGHSIFNYYTTINANIEKGNLEDLPQLHALAAGLKAFCTSVAADGVEICRLACGGHGYSHASGLPWMYTKATVECTYEGENTVMFLQTARYLVKCYNQMKMKKSLPSSFAYITDNLSGKSDLDNKLNFDSIIEAYEHRAARLIKAAALNITFWMKAGNKVWDSTNKSSIQMVWAAKASCHLFVVKTFINLVTSANLDPKVRTALTTLCRLYAVNGMIENMGQFSQDGFLNETQINMLNGRLSALLEEVRANAVAFVDAFEYHDNELHSCLGRYDGQVYEALYKYAKSSPLNDTDVHSSFHKYLAPLKKESKL